MKTGILILISAGKGKVSLSTLSRRLVKIEVQLQVSLTLVLALGTYLVVCWVGPRGGMDFLVEENPFPLQEFEARIFQLVALSLHKLQRPALGHFHKNIKTHFTVYSGVC
jgi:hypothetical protein